jgi:hypothetical protein
LTCALPIFRLVTYSGGSSHSLIYFHFHPSIFLYAGAIPVSKGAADYDRKSTHLYAGHGGLVKERQQRQVNFVMF